MGMFIVLMMLVLAVCAISGANNPGKNVNPQLTLEECHKWLKRFRSGDLSYALEIIPAIKNKGYSDKSLGVKKGELTEYESTARWQQTSGWAVECRKGIMTHAGLLYIRMNTVPYTDALIGLEADEVKSFATIWLGQVLNGIQCVSGIEKLAIVKTIVSECKEGDNHAAGFAYVLTEIYALPLSCDEKEFIQKNAVAWVKLCCDGVLNPVDLHQPPAFEGALRITTMSWTPKVPA